MAFRQGKLIADLGPHSVNASLAEVDVLAWLRIALNSITVSAAILVGVIAPQAQAISNDTSTARGLTAYLGVMPAEIVKGHPSTHPEGAMHGGAPESAHEYHVVVAIFDAASGARVSDATVTAKISGLGLPGHEKTLEPMVIANTITYGGFFQLPGADLYTVSVTVKRPGSQAPVVLEFRYDHRRQ